MREPSPAASSCGLAERPSAVRRASMEQVRSFWKHCSTCKAEIPFGARYQACNVSTCNRGNTALAFCSVECWDAHVPLLRHRDAWSVEQRAPSRDECWDAHVPLLRHRDAWSVEQRAPSRDEWLRE